MADDPLDRALEDAVTRCPKCLVLLDDEGEDFPYLACPECGDVFL